MIHRLFIPKITDISYENKTTDLASDQHQKTYNSTIQISESLESGQHNEYNNQSYPKGTIQIGMIFYSKKGLNSKFLCLHV